MSWRDVEGWWYDEEAATAQRYAKDGDVLELGAYNGRSTLCFAEVAKLVVSVDWHRGDDSVGVTDTLGTYLRHVRDRPNVIPIIGRIETVARLVRGFSFDFALVDGAHDDASACHDVRFARRAVRPGGVVAVHDYTCGQMEGICGDLLGSPLLVADMTGFFQIGY